MNTSHLRPPILVAVVALVLLLAGCGGYDSTALPKTKAQPTESAAPDTGPSCTNDGSELRSYKPQGDFESGTAIKKIRDRKRLIVGVASDIYLLGFRNIEDNNKIDGFDIDMADAIAARIFGTAKDHVELKVITAADRIPSLQNDDVDIVARNMTINCERWKQIAFSQEYFRSGQKVLAGKGSGITSIADLAGKRICAPAGTTSIANIQKIAPRALPVSATDDSECLVKFQNGQADALSTDDTVLAGLAAQDPYAVVLKTKALTKEPYGIGVKQGNVDLVMLINDTLEKMRRDGRWQRSYDKWLAPALGPNTQPQAVYGR